MADQTQPGQVPTAPELHCHLQADKENLGPNGMYLEGRALFDDSAQPNVSKQGKKKRSIRRRHRVPLQDITWLFRNQVAEPREETASEHLFEFLGAFSDSSTQTGYEESSDDSGGSVLAPSRGGQKRERDEENSADSIGGGVKTAKIVTLRRMR